MKNTKLIVLSLLTVSMLLVGGCMPEEVAEPTTEEVSESSEESVESSESTVSSESITESEESSTINEPVLEPELQQKATYQDVLEVLQVAFEGGFIVEYDEINNVYTFMARDSQLVDEIVSTLSGQLSPDAWNMLAEEFRILSGSVSETLNDPTVGFVILNPFDRELALLMVQNKTILYNVTDDMTGGY